MKSLWIFLIFWAGSLSAQHTYIFVGSYNFDKTAKGIYVFELDTVSGQLQERYSYTGIANPSFIRLSADGQLLYACTESKTPKAGSVSAFRFEPIREGLLLLNSQPSGGENPVYLSVSADRRWLVNANYTEGSLSVYPLLADGRIDKMVQHVRFSEGSVNQLRQEKSHVHSAVFANDFRYVYFPDLGADKIRGYRFDSVAGLRLDDSVVCKAVAGSGPRHLVFHPVLPYAYCTEEMAGYVSVYGYKEGRLERVQRVSMHKGGGVGGYESSDVHVSPDGRFLYAANRGKENNIVIYKIDGGRLKLVGYQRTYGKHPRSFVVDGSGRYLVVANAESGGIVVFKRDGETGRLRKFGEVGGMKNPSSVQVRAY